MPSFEIKDVKTGKKGIFKGKDQLTAMLKAADKFNLNVKTATVDVRRIPTPIKPVKKINKRVKVPKFSIWR